MSGAPEDVGRGPTGTGSASPTSTLLSRALGPDRPADLALVVGVFATYLLADRLTRTAAHLELADLGRFSLVVAAIGHRWYAVAVLALVAGALAWRAPTRQRLLAPWSSLEQGRTLRLLAGTVVVVLAWQGSLYRYNWLADRLHGADRLLLVALAAAALARPAFLLPFALVVRVVGEQFVFPFATPAGRNIDDFLVLVVVAVAAGHLVHVVTGRNRTSPVLLVIAAALAAHFFIPGKGKVAIGWLTTGDLSNLPLASYTAGWLGHTDGAWSQTLAGGYHRFRVPVMAATLALELGSLVAVTHPRLTRWWLPGCVAFHLMTFTTTGFWFLPWIVVEVGLLVVLWAPSLRSWVGQNATPARGLVTALAVIGAPVLFHPPGLAWLDAPVSYGYQLEGIGADGTAYHVPATALAPLSHHVAFDRLQLGPDIPASGAYGAVADRAGIDAVAGVETFEDLGAVEATLGPPTLVEPSQAFLARFLTFAHGPRSAPWTWLGPPEHFWTSRAEPTFRFQQPLDELRVYLVRAIHHDGHPEHHRDAVLTLRIDDDGRAVVVEPDAS